MPSLDILNTHILYSASNPADGDTGSADPAPVGPNVDPQLQQFINSFGQMPQNIPAPSAPVTARSEVANFSPLGLATVLMPANLPAGAFAGVDSPLPPPDPDSSDPAPVGPSYDPGLQQFINSFGQMPQNIPAPSAPVTARSEVANFSPLGLATVLMPANFPAGAFAGADSPLPPSDPDSSDPAPVGPSYDPGLQQFINSFGQPGQPQDNPAPPVPVIQLPGAPAEPFHGAEYLSSHRVRLHP